MNGIIDAIWITNEEGGKAAWHKRTLFIAVDDVNLFLEVAENGTEILASEGVVYYPADYLSSRKQSKEWNAKFDKWTAKLYRVIAEQLEDERKKKKRPAAQPGVYTA